VFSCQTEVATILKHSKAFRNYLCLTHLKGTGKVKGLGRGKRTTQQIRWEGIAINVNIIAELPKPEITGKIIASVNRGVKRIVYRLRSGYHR